jgi:iron complex transport system ATP-binding protein
VTLALHVKDLGFGYPERAVGRGVSFSLEEGRVLVLLGPNGSGKTTLFKTLLGLLAPQAGSIEVMGSPLDALSRADLARRMGYVPQAYAGYFPFTVFDMVLMGRTAHLGPFAGPGRHDREVARATLERLGIGELADRPYTRISGGQRQLALVARALAQEPRILVMDEPTASLDFGNQVRVLEQIRRLAAQGLAVILSTHHPDHAFLCAHQVVLLANGGVANQGSPAEVVTDQNLQAVYGVDVSVQPVEGARVCVPRLSAGGAPP